MKRIEVRKNKVVESPWLRIEEAAAYCGMSRSTFCARATASRLPFSGEQDFKLYHIKILDAWINNDLPESPFDADPVLPGQITRRIRRQLGDNRLINPVNGKVSRGKKYEGEKHA
jgi:hypothetical protein